MSDTSFSSYLILERVPPGVLAVSRRKPYNTSGRYYYIRGEY